MIKLDPSPTSLTYATPSEVAIESICRLVVLVPAGTENGAATRRIWELANVTGMRIQLIGLCKDATEEPGLRRGLVTMASLLQNGQASVEWKIEAGTNWVEAARRNLQACDMVVCFAEQRVGLLHKPLSQILRSDLTVPLYILSGLYPQNASRSRWAARAAAWIGSIAIIAGFFVLQTRITLLTDWTQMVLMLLSTGVEVWAIWNWNSLLE